MLKFMSEFLLVLSILIRFTILKKILTYKLKGKENKNITFFILLLLIYAVNRLLNIGDIYIYNIKFIFDIVIIITWGIYYNYYYRITYIKYIISFYFFNIYYELVYEVLERILFIIFTGYSSSSKEALLVSTYESQKIYLYTYILLIIVFVILTIVTNHLQLLSTEKRNYIYLTIALTINVINIIGRYTLGRYYISNNIFINKYINEWRTSVPILHEEWAYFDQFVVPKLVLASTIIIILLFRKTIEENKLKSQNEIIQNKLDMQYAHYLSVQESHMKVKKLYHDINNHITCIDHLKNSKEVNEYIDNLKYEIKDFKSIYNTGDMILDIIIHEKSELCNKKGIKFICNINFSKMNFIKPIDISSIFANILDNAIEACEKIDNKKSNRYIEIKGNIRKGYFVLKCENSRTDMVNRDKNILLTDKKNKFLHGLGIMNIKSSLEKYNGELTFGHEKGKFILNIYIPLVEKTDS